MVRFNIIEYLKDNKWSSDVQDAMIEFIEDALKDDHIREKALARALLSRIGPER